MSQAPSERFVLELVRCMYWPHHAGPVELTVRLRRTDALDWRTLDVSIVADRVAIHARKVRLASSLYPALEAVLAEPFRALLFQTSEVARRLEVDLDQALSTPWRLWSLELESDQVVVNLDSGSSRGWRGSFQRFAWHQTGQRPGRLAFDRPGRLAFDPSLFLSPYARDEQPEERPILQALLEQRTAPALAQLHGLFTQLPHEILIHR